MVVPEELTVRGRENSPIITVFLFPLIRRVRVQFFWGLQGKDIIKVKSGMEFCSLGFLWIPTKIRQHTTVKDAHSTHCNQLSHYFEGHKCGFVLCKGQVRPEKQPIALLFCVPPIPLLSKSFCSQSWVYVGITKRMVKTTDSFGPLLRT